MYDFMAWLQASAVGETMRGLGVWAYGIANLTHILGVASLFGATLVLDLRLLGVWRSVPLAAIEKPTVPIAAAGLSVAVVSGVCMISTNATDYVGNPFIYIKFPAIVLALLNVAVLNLLPAWKARTDRELSRKEQRQLAVTGGISLVSWLTAVSAARMIGYW